MIIGDIKEAYFTISEHKQISSQKGTKDLKYDDLSYKKIWLPIFYRIFYHSVKSKWNKISKQINIYSLIVTV